MDGVDLVTVATLGQTIVLAVTLIMLIFQFPSQEKAVKDAAYQKVLDDAAFRAYFSGITNSSKPSQTIEGDE